MSQAKLRPGLYSVLFFLAVFLLTSVGLAALYYGVLPSSLSLLFILFFVAGWALLFACAVDLFGGRDKPSGRKVLVLTLGVMLVSTLFTHLVWTITTPRWFFSVSTDRAVYELGEPVTITASLINMGFIAHSFKSLSDKPVWVRVVYIVGRYDGYEVWYSPLGYDPWDQLSQSVTEFSVRANETLERNFIWNQTNTSHPGLLNQTYMPGTYRITAFIPSERALEDLFLAWTSINVTSS